MRRNLGHDPPMFRQKNFFIFPSEKAALLMHGTLERIAGHYCRVEIEGDRLYILWVQQEGSSTKLKLMSMTISYH
jgi:hypothetical protein